MLDFLSKGALPALKKLYLHENKIADTGMIALADAVGRGALDKIENIFLFGNPGNSEPVDKVLRERKK